MKNGEIKSNKSPKISENGGSSCIDQYQAHQRRAPPLPPPSPPQPTTSPHPTPSPHSPLPSFHAACPKPSHRARFRRIWPQPTLLPRVCERRAPPLPPPHPTKIGRATCRG